MRKQWLLAGAVCCLAAAAASAQSPTKFPFHDGDRVVFLGDSITEQRLYTTYIETYLLTRFPTWQLQFRNAGWGGDTSYLRQRQAPFADALQRDVLSLNPTVVTIDFSMNDAGYGAFRQDLYDQHYQGEWDLVRDLKKAGVRPVVLSVSAVEKKEPGNDLEGYNQTLEQFAAGDEQIAQKEQVPFADQLHPFIDAINLLRTIDPNTRLSGDVVHPGKAGHLLMADFILTGLNAPADVSSVTIDAGSGQIENLRGAHVGNVGRNNGGITFTRQDDALVFPIEPQARPALELVPVVQNLDRYMLTVTHLAPGDYQVNVNDQPVAHYSAADLENGVNLASYDSPLTAPGMQILQHVYHKNDLYFNRWRNVSLKPNPDKAMMDDLASQITSEEQQIDALRKPPVFSISVMPVALITPPAPSSTVH